jgi:twitching motility protein PilT
VHLQAGLPPNLRLGGHLKATNQPPITDEELRAFIKSIVPARMRETIDERIQAGLDFSYTSPTKSRFRCSA